MPTSRRPLSTSPAAPQAIPLLGSQLGRGFPLWVLHSGHARCLAPFPGGRAAEFKACASQGYCHSRFPTAVDGPSDWGKRRGGVPAGTQLWPSPTTLLWPHQPCRLLFMLCRGPGSLGGSASRGVGWSPVLISATLLATHAPSCLPGECLRKSSKDGAQ